MIEENCLSSGAYPFGEKRKRLRLLVSPPKKKFKYVETKTIQEGLNMLFEGKPDSLPAKTSRGCTF